MPSGANAKQAQTKIQKIVEDKTFGLKNKNKSKKVQQYVKNVQESAKYVGRSREEVVAEEKRRAERAAAKKAKSEEAVMMNMLFKVIPKARVPEGVDPKTVVCEEFMRGRCTRGKKCQFSHDAANDRRTEKINIYEDPRQQDTMDAWDQAKLEQVIGTKQAGRGVPPTDIVCKYFLDAVEKSKYGWFWECPNGPQCHYRHCLPPGYVFRPSSKKTVEQSQIEEVDVSEQIEEERKKLDISKCTPITPETFAAWKEKRNKEKQEKIEADRIEAAKKVGGRGVSVLSGRALFQFDPTLFEDDEGAAGDTDYVVEDKKDEDAEDVGFASGAKPLDEQDEIKGENEDDTNGSNDEGTDGDGEDVDNEDEEDVNDGEPENDDEAQQRADPEIDDISIFPPAAAAGTSLPAAAAAAASTLATGLEKLFQEASPASTVGEERKDETKGKKDKKDKKDKEKEKEKEKKDKDKKDKKSKKDKKETALTSAAVAGDESLFLDDNVPDE